MVNIRYGAPCGLKPDIYRGPGSATAQNRCAIARCAGSPTASAVIGGEIVDRGHAGALLEDRGVVDPASQTGVAYEYGSYQPAAPAHDRGHEDSRKLGAHTQRSHIYSCKRFAAFLERSPDTATLEDIRLFQLHLAETGMSICNRNRIMTGVRFLLRVNTAGASGSSAEIYHLREPQKIPQVMSPTRRGACWPRPRASRPACCSVSAMAACAPARWSG